MDDDAPKIHPPEHGRFPDTRWTLVSRLKSADTATARRALDDLCAHYYYPLYCYIRHRGFDHHDAQDALQDFFAKLIRLESFEEADASRGRLRAYLATSLRRFLVNWRRDQGHRWREVSLDPPDEEAEQRFRAECFTDADTPERIFDRKWGLTLLERVIHRLAQEYAARGRTHLFDALRPVLLAGGSLRGGDTAQLAATLAMSEGALRVALSRLLREYRDLLEQEVLQTVEARSEVDAEIAHLLDVFQAV